MRSASRPDVQLWVGTRSHKTSTQSFPSPTLTSRRSSLHARTRTRTHPTACISCPPRAPARTHVSHTHAHARAHTQESVLVHVADALSNNVTGIVGACFFHGRMHVYLLARRHAYIHTCMHGRMHMYTYLHTYINTCMHTYIHTCMHACMHTYMHTCIHTYIHT